MFRIFSVPKNRPKNHFFSKSLLARIHWMQGRKLEMDGESDLFATRTLRSEKRSKRRDKSRSDLPGNGFIAGRKSNLLFCTNRSDVSPFLAASGPLFLLGCFEFD